MVLSIPLDIIIWLQSFQDVAVFNALMNFVSLLGEEYFYIVVLGMIYWVVSKRFGEYLGITLGTSITLNNTLKEIFNLPRPFQEYPNQVDNLREYTATGSAFPSGHVQGSSSLFFAIYFYLKKRMFLIAAIIITVLMMISRMYLGVHYIQDVIFGAFIGVSVACANYYFFKRFKDNDRLLHRYYLILILLFLPGFILIQGNDFFKGYGILVGLVFGIMLEKRFVSFSLIIPWAKRIIRLVLGLVLMAGTLIIVKEIFGVFNATEGGFIYNLLDFIRYFLVAFVGFGLYPMLFTKLKF